MRSSTKYGDALPIALLRAREATLARFRSHVSEQGLTLEQWRVIRALAEHQRLTTVKLSTFCALLPPSLSRILKTLEERGLVTSTAGPDRRTKLTELTQRGQTLFDGMIGKTQQIYGDLENLIGKQELEDLIEKLARLREVLTGSSSR